MESGSGAPWYLQPMNITTVLRQIEVASKAYMLEAFFPGIMSAIDSEGTLKETSVLSKISELSKTATSITQGHTPTEAISSTATKETMFHTTSRTTGSAIEGGKDVIYKATKDTVRGTHSASNTESTDINPIQLLKQFLTIFDTMKNTIQNPSKLTPAETNTTTVNTTTIKTTTTATNDTRNIVTTSTKPSADTLKTTTKTTIQNSNSTKTSATTYFTAVTTVTTSIRTPLPSETRPNTVSKTINSVSISKKTTTPVYKSTQKTSLETQQTTLTTNTVTLNDETTTSWTHTRHGCNDKSCLPEDQLLSQEPCSAKFCQCSWGVPHPKLCPQGLVFNPSAGVCDWIWNNPQCAFFL